LSIAPTEASQKHGRGSFWRTWVALHFRDSFFQQHQQTGLESRTQQFFPLSAIHFPQSIDDFLVDGGGDDLGFSPIQRGAARAPI